MADLFTIKPGNSPTKLYNNPGEIFLFNTDTANSVWVDDNGSIEPGNGQELPPLGFLQWDGTDPLFAICDTGVNAPIKLRASASVKAMTTPLIISGGTIEATIAGGEVDVNIPGQVTVDIADAQIVGIDPAGNNVNQQYAQSILAQTTINNGNTLSVDVSEWSEILIRATSTGTGSIFYAFMDATNTTVFDNDLIPITNAIQGALVRLAANGSILNLINVGMGGTQVAVTVIGTNRTANARNDQRRLIGKMDQWVGTTSGVAGALALTQNDVSVHMQGPCFAAFYVSGTSTGYFALVDIAGNLLRVTDTTEMTASVNGPRVITKSIAVPVGASWEFVATGTQHIGDTAQVSLVSAAQP